MFKLNNKNIVISAAADGIGRCIAEFCMTHGANVYISDINDNKLSDFSKHENFNKNLFIQKVNASNFKEVEEYFFKLKKKINTIDALINNIGVAGPTGKIEELAIDDWNKTIQININSHFYFTKYAIPFLKNNGGSIINISSTGGLFGFPFRSPYAASKWAIIGITKTLAMELGEYNIRVNAICPGSVYGDRMKRVIEAKAKSLGVMEDNLQKDYESMVSLNTFVSKEDIANMAVFLLSHEAHKISGQVITVDGNTERMN